jgi:polysaccharide deacetylase family protein (PEP-CTERM system associated)
MAQIRHHFTIDVEEYYQVLALEPYVDRSRWPGMESRLMEGMGRLLDLLEATETRGTFFILGVVAERDPDLVRRLAGAGHEVASHGWDHRRASHITPDEFRRQARASRSLLEDLSGQSVVGYRAPSFSILRGGEWALEILVEEGYRYDSSLYPVRRPGYGYAGGERAIHTLQFESGPLIEVPPATLRVAGGTFPAAGGGTFRHLPYGLTRAAFEASERDGVGPATFYIHPWELDPGQPRVPGISWLTRLRHYGGLHRTEPRIRMLLEHLRFQPIGVTLGTMPAR